MAQNVGSWGLQSALHGRKVRACGLPLGTAPLRARTRTGRDFL